MSPTDLQAMKDGQRGLETVGDGERIGKITVSIYFKALNKINLQLILQFWKVNVFQYWLERSLPFTVPDRLYEFLFLIVFDLFITVSERLKQWSSSNRFGLKKIIKRLEMVRKGHEIVKNLDVNADDRARWAVGKVLAVHDHSKNVSKITVPGTITLRSRFESSQVFVYKNDSYLYKSMVLWYLIFKHQYKVC
jgi:hypothetical protein